MENASRALIMAGGVLIALIIITILLIMYNNITNYEEAKVERTRGEELAKFNMQYLTYNRKNVRGNELITLANKIISHNETRTDAVVINGIGYEPLTLNIILRTKGKSPEKTYEEFRYDTGEANKLFTEENYTESGNSYKLSSIQKTIKGLAKFGVTEDMLDKLATGITKIFFLDTNEYNDGVVTADGESKLKMAIKNFNIICGRKILKSGTDVELDESRGILKGDKDLKMPGYSAYGNIRESVFLYYEYKEFKKARFDCVNASNSNLDGIEYYKDSNGAETRVKSLTFRFTGELD